MNRFTQLHLLSFYPASNLNRDDLGRPKSVMIGGTNRLRISSQSLKRAWRTSDLFEEALKGYIGRRTKNMGIEIFEKLVAGGVDEKKAIKFARSIAEQFGKSKGEDKNKDEEKRNKLQELEIEQLAHFTPEEEQAIARLIEKLIETQKAPEADDLDLLIKRHTAADVAMFGRMLAGSPSYNTEAAVQVAHAFTVNRVQIEDDFFTAVDDINLGVDAGAGHMGSTEFGAGVFYQYVCIDRELLRENLSRDKELFNKTLDALLNCAAKVSPTGKQNSFASRSHATFIMAENGDQQPRSLSAAFIEPVKGENQMNVAITKLKDLTMRMDKAYGACAAERVEMNINSGEGSLAEIVSFIQEN